MNCWLARWFRTPRAYPRYPGRRQARRHNHLCGSSSLETNPSHEPLRKLAVKVVGPASPHCCIISCKRQGRIQWTARDDVDDAPQSIAAIDVGNAALHHFHGIDRRAWEHGPNRPSHQTGRPGECRRKSPGRGWHRWNPPLRSETPREVGLAVRLPFRRNNVNPGICPSASVRSVNAAARLQIPLVQYRHTRCRVAHSLLRARGGDSYLFRREPWARVISIGFEL